MGIPGLLLWAAFLILLVCPPRDWVPKMAWAFAGSGLFVGLFNHNPLESRQVVIVAALLLVASVFRKPA